MPFSKHIMLSGPYQLAGKLCAVLAALTEYQDTPMRRMICFLPTHAMTCLAVMFAVSMPHL